QFAGPVAVGGEMLVQEGDDRHALELSQQQGEVIDPFDLEGFEEVVDHAQSRSRRRKELLEKRFRTVFYEGRGRVVRGKVAIPREEGRRAIRGKSLLIRRCGFKRARVSVALAEVSPTIREVGKI